MRPTIRAALAEHLGVGPRFRVVQDESLSRFAHVAGPAAGGRRARRGASTSASSTRPRSRRRSSISTELVDAPTAEAAVDSVSRLQNDFGATVVDEIPRT